MSRRKLLIAIDGPAGAGKSAAARELALRLGVAYLDTGAMYRAVAVAAVKAGVRFPLDADGRRRVETLARTVEIAFEGEPSAQRVLLDGRDVTGELRTPEISQLSSVVSALAGVRRELVRRQRELAAGGGVVEGRDIGTVVFPDAPLKVFVTATPEVRARRRFDELRARGVTVEWDEVLREQVQRDRRDATRASAPLRPAEGAVVVDTSELSLEQVVERLVGLVRESLDTD